MTENETILYDALKYVKRVIDPIAKIERLAQGGEQEGNIMHVWDAQQIINNALEKVKLSMASKPMNKEIKPLNPGQVAAAATKRIPQSVITAVNKLLIRNYSNSTITIKQSELIDEILELDSELTREKIFGNGWLNFEPLFRNQGWEVDYDRPGYNENYDPKWTFNVPF